MALSRRARDRQIDYWPGFVDALSTLLLVFTFLIAVFMLGQFFIGREMAGKEDVLQRLTRQLSELSDLLALERSAKAEGEQRILSLSATLQKEQAERERLAGLAAGAGQSQQQLGSLTQQLADEKTAAQRALEQVTLLNQQINALRQQLQALEGALEQAESREKDSQTRIAELGSRLNVALAQRVQELNKYRSDFFGRLRNVLGARPDVTDRGRPLRVPVRDLLWLRRGGACWHRPWRTRQARRPPEEPRTRDPAGYRLGRTHRRPYGQASAFWRRPVQGQLGTLGGARHRGGALSRGKGRFATSRCCRGLRRIRAHRFRRHARGARPQPPPRTEDHRTMSIHIRTGSPSDHAMIAEIWEAAWSETYPGVNFSKRRALIEEQLREAETGRYRLRVAEMSGARVGFTLVEKHSGLLEIIAVIPARWGMASPNC